MSRDERLERFAEDCPSGTTGHVSIMECSVCGSLNWRSTDSNRPKGYSVSEQAGCDSLCHAAFRREPEVTQWVLAALSKLREDLARATPQEPKP